MPSAPRQESAGNFAIARRKKVFTGLLVFCGSTLALGLMPGLHWLLWLNVIGDLVLAVMVSFLVSLQAAKRESRQYTPRRVAGPRPTAALPMPHEQVAPRPTSFWDDREEYPGPRHLAPAMTVTTSKNEYLKPAPLAPGGYVLSDPFETDSSLVRDARPRPRPQFQDYDDEEPLLRVGGL